MNKFLTIALLALLSSSVFASDKVSEIASEFSLDGTVGITTDYRFRGISQSQQDAAVNGSIDLNHTSGAHIGVWGSSIKFDETGEDNASIELDWKAGYRFDVSDVDMDLGYIYYSYPNNNSDSNFDYGEIYLDAGWEGVAGGVSWTDDGFDKSGKATYLYVGYGHEFFDMLTLSAVVGNTWYNKFEFDNGQDRYMNYEVAATVTVLDSLDIKLSQVGTDLKRQDLGGLDWAEDATILTVTLNM